MKSIDIIHVLPKLGNYVKKLIDNFIYLSFPFSLIIFLPDLVIAVLCYCSDSIKNFFIQYLSASLITPWGVVTSLFVHRNIDHFTSDVIATFLALFIFALINIKTDDITNFSRLLFYYALGIAILSNILWTIIPWIYSYPNILSERSFGSSGIGYALYGIDMSSMIFNLHYMLWQKIVQHKEFHTLAFLINFIFFFLLTYTIFYTNIFFFKDLHVNSFVHALSFLLGYIITIIYNILSRFHFYKIVSKAFSNLSSYSKDISG